MRLVQEAADAGRIGGIIKVIVGRSPGFLMESLRKGDEIVTDAHTIAKMITSFFANWFSRLPEEHARDVVLAKCVIERNKKDWDDLINGMGIPIGVAENMWIAFSPRPISDEGKREAELLADYCPSIAEFEDFIFHLKSRSAPGHSGLSYLMVKLWPRAFITRAYECLCEAWANKEGMEGWSIRLLAPIPKKTNPTIDDLRPLMLVEVMRKIWVGLLMKRIKAFWAKHSLINDNQHAYLRGKGTETAIPQIINTMESAKEFSTDLYLSSWDMSKAFDNLSREMILLSLLRLHIPKTVADYIISLDVGGRVMVRTPWLLDKLRSSDPVLSESDYFITEKGTGQGDVPSSILWVAAYDVPLVALAAVKSDFKIQDLNCNAIPANDVGYADDLVSLTATLACLQDKADVMSCWSLLSNVKMNTTKLRTFGILWGANREMDGSLIIHGEGWSSVLVEINHDGFLTHLGVIWNMDLEGDKQFESILETLEELGSRILRHVGRVGDKLLALEYCLRSNIVYRMQFCVWGLDRYEAIDKAYTRIVKRITRNMVSFPSIPLWTLAADGGLGLQSVLDFSHKSKLRILLRNIEKTDNTGIAFQGLVARALRYAGVGGLPHNRQEIPSCLSHTTWLTSLVQWLEKLGLIIVVQGPRPCNYFSQMIVTDPAGRIDRFERGIALVGEDSMSPTPHPIAIRAGQCWEVAGKVLEIVAFAGDYVECLEWSPSHPHLFPGVRLTVDTADNYSKYSKGLGSDTRVLLSTITQSTALIERSEDEMIKIPSMDPSYIGLPCEELQSTVIRTRNRSPIVDSHAWLTEEPQVITVTKDLYIAAAYTDGSWCTTHTLSSFLLNTGVVKSAGAIVLLTVFGLLTIRVEIDIDHVSAFVPEVLSLLIAHEIVKGRSISIWSDCEAAIKSLNGGCLGSLAQVISGWKKNRNIKFEKVRAHPERFNTPDLWSKEEKGNFLADQVAGGVVLPALVVKASDWLRRIGSCSKITIEDISGCPMISDIRLRKSRIDTECYLKTRDKYRVKALKTPHWVGANISLHHKLMGRSKSIGDLVITQRIGLIKRWQWFAGRIDNICQGCLAPILDITHPLRSCTHVDMKEARDSIWKDVEVLIMRSRRDDQKILFLITRLMREQPGGETACCGSFRRDFVQIIPDSNANIDDVFKRTLLKILKTICSGSRRLLRLAAELQRGPLGINLRQAALSEFFKPVRQDPILRKRRITKEASRGDSEASKKNRNKKIIILRNSQELLSDVFENPTQTGNLFYWEFKAG